MGLSSLCLRWVDELKEVLLPPLNSHVFLSISICMSMSSGLFLHSPVLKAGWSGGARSLCQSVDEVASQKGGGSRSHYSKCSVSGHSRPLMILWCDLVVVWFAHTLRLSALDSHSAAARRTIRRWIAILLLKICRPLQTHRPVMSGYRPQVQHWAISAGHLAVEICSEY